MREINFIALGNFEDAGNGVGPWGHHGKQSLRSSADRQFLMTTTLSVAYFFRRKWKKGHSSELVHSAFLPVTQCQRKVADCFK